MPALPPEEIQNKLKQSPGWQVDGEVLKKEFEFPSFTDSMIFVNELAQAADDANHYPSSLDIRGQKVVLTLVSPDGFISEKDLLLIDCAAQAEAAARNS